MNTLSGENEPENCVVSCLRNHEEPMAQEEIAAECNISEKELRATMSDLLDKHRIKMTPEWEYELKK